MSSAPHSPHLVDALEAALADAPAVGEAPVRRGAAPPALLVRPTLPGLLRDAAVDWAIMGAAWLGMALSPGWSWPLWALIVAGRLHALGVVLHDAAHMPLRGKPPAARLLEALAGWPIATTLEAMRYHHLRHHRDSGMATDPYFKAGLVGDPRRWSFRIRWLLQCLRGLLLMPFWTVRPWFGLAALAWPGLRVAYGRAFLQDRDPGADLRRSPELIACARAELGQLLAQAVVIAAIVRWPAPLLLGYVIPAVAAGVLAAWRLLCEHSYVPTLDRRPETLLATTHDHHLGWLGHAVLAPRHIGYHVCHHLHPQVSWRALPALRRWYQASYPDRYPAPRGTRPQ